MFSPRAFDDPASKPSFGTSTCRSVSPRLSLGVSSLMDELKPALLLRIVHHYTPLRLSNPAFCVAKSFGPMCEEKPFAGGQGTRWARVEYRVHEDTKNGVSRFAPSPGDRERTRPPIE